MKMHFFYAFSIKLLTFFPILYHSPYTLSQAIFEETYISSKYIFSNSFRNFDSIFSLSKFCLNSCFREVAIFSIFSLNSVSFMFNPIPNYYVFCYFSFCIAFCKYSSGVFFRFLLYHLDILFLKKLHISLLLLLLVFLRLLMLNFLN